MINNYLNKGIYLLEELGINAYAYDYLSFCEVLKYIEQEKDIILGGDIYIEKNKKMVDTYNNWYYDGQNYKLDSEKSLEVARKYISQCIEWYGEKFYIVPVICKGIYKPDKTYVGK